MNAYDRLPFGLKIIHQIILLGPAISAGIFQHSWKSAAFVFFFGTVVLGQVFNTISSALIGRLCRLPDGEVDQTAFHRIFIWPFLASGPLGGALVAAYLFR